MDKEADTSSSESDNNIGDSVKVKYDLISENISLSTDTTLGSSIANVDSSNEATAEEQSLLKEDAAVERTGPTGEEYGQEEIIAYVTRPSKEKRTEKSPNPKSEPKFLSTIFHKLKNISPPKEDEQHMLEEESLDESTDSLQFSYSQAKSKSMTENLPSTSTDRKSRTRFTYVLPAKKKTKPGLTECVDLTKVAAYLHSEPEKGISQSASSTAGYAKPKSVSPSKTTSLTTSNPLETTSSTVNPTNNPLETTSSTVNPSELSNISKTFDFQTASTSSTQCRLKRLRPVETYSSLKAFQLPTFGNIDPNKASTSKPSQRARSKSEELHKIKRDDSGLSQTTTKLKVKSFLQKCQKAVSPNKEKQESSPKMKATILETSELTSDIILRPRTESEQEARKLPAFRKSPVKSKRSSSLDVLRRIKLSSTTEVTPPQALLKETLEEIQSQYKLKEKSKLQKDISQAGPSSECVQLEDSELKLEKKETTQGETTESVAVDETKGRQGTPLRRARKDDEKEERPRKRPNT